MSNWKNVNNWHWTEKNCIQWARNYFDEKLAGLEVDHDGINVKLEKVNEVNGDVDLNQRKGKIITLYDMELKLKWKGETSDGVEAEGRITIPEVAHDTDVDDYVFEVTVDSDSRSKDPIRQVVRQKLTQEIKKVFLTFTDDLIKSHSKDVYIEPSQLGQPSQLKPVVVAKEVPVNKESGAETKTEVKIGDKDQKVNVTTVKDTVEFVASANDVYVALTDPTLVSIWTRSGCDIKNLEGSDFSLFGGNITGTILELVPGKKIVQKWRNQNWPANHYSTVTMLLEEQTSSCNLILEQAGVPVGEQDVTKRNWSLFYWNSIKSTFGYGACL